MVSQKVSSHVAVYRYYHNKIVKLQLKYLYYLYIYYIKRICRHMWFIVIQSTMISTLNAFN
jgi:hypothetical protein